MARKSVWSRKILRVLNSDGQGVYQIDGTLIFLLMRILGSK